MKKNTLKIIIDLAMLVLFAALMFGYSAGAVFHEAAGIAVGVLFIAHIALNARMLKRMISAAMSGSITNGKLGVLVTDLILLVFMPLDLVTGIAISDALFGFEFSDIIYTVHNISSWVCLCVITFHFALHLKYVIAIIRKMFSGADAGRLKKAAAGVCSAVAASVIIYFTVSASVGMTGDGVSDEASLPVSAAVSDPPESEITEAKSKEDSEAEDEISESPSGDSGAEEIPTLEEYLSKLFCSGCHNRCPLTSPRCGKGRAQAQQAESEYSAKYSG